jgi:hypothetical protein
MMTAEIIWTIVFGVVATAIGLVTIWQNFQIAQVKVESVLPIHKIMGGANAFTVLQRAQDRPWYRYGP